LLVLSSGLVVTAASAERAITPHVAEYKVKVSVLSGKLTTQVQPTDGGYAAQSIVRAAGLARMFVRGDVTEYSTFEIIDDGVRPLAYNSSDLISKEDKFMQFEFDWDEDRVSGSVNDQPVQMDLDGRVFDRVSLQYELMLDLLNERKNDEYSLLDDDELKVLQVTHLGEREIKVPFGKFAAVGVQHRKANSKSDRVTTLWCVEKLDYLPVLIEQHRDGKLAMRAVLTEYTPSAVQARL
jgi:hypothetical protein